MYSVNALAKVKNGYKERGKLVYQGQIVAIKLIKKATLMSSPFLGGGEGAGIEPLIPVLVFLKGLVIEIDHSATF